MRSSKQRSRSKQNRPRPVGNIINRVFDSSGPDGKVRGTPQQIIEKYQILARDAQLSNDRVAAENFLQHAEHYTRMLAEATREMNAEAEARRIAQEAQQQRDQQQRDQQQQREQQHRDRQAGDQNNRDGNSRDRQGAQPNVPKADPRSENDAQSRDGQPSDAQTRDSQPRDSQSRDGQPRDGQRDARHSGQRSGADTAAASGAGRDTAIGEDPRGDMDGDSNLVNTPESRVMTDLGSDQPPVRNTRKRPARVVKSTDNADADAADSAVAPAQTSEADAKPAVRKRAPRKPKPTETVKEDDNIRSDQSAAE